MQRLSLNAIPILLAACSLQKPLEIVQRCVTDWCPLERVPGLGWNELSGICSFHEMTEVRPLSQHGFRHVLANIIKRWKITCTNQTSINRLK